MREVIDAPLIKSSRNAQNLRQRWQDSEKSSLSIINLILTCRLTTSFLYRSAREAAEEALAIKTASGSSSRIAVPGTPRNTGGHGVTGIGAGARVTQTPRRRVGI